MSQVCSFKLHSQKVSYARKLVIDTVYSKSVKIQSANSRTKATRFNLPITTRQRLERKKQKIPRVPLRLNRSSVWPLGHLIVHNKVYNTSRSCTGKKFIEIQHHSFFQTSWISHISSQNSPLNWYKNISDSMAYSSSLFHSAICSQFKVFNKH